MNTKNPFEVPTEMRDLASRSVEQARKAFDTFIGAAHKSASIGDTPANPVQQSLADATKRTVAFAETNVKAAFELAERLAQAKTVEDVMKAQGDFLQNQARNIQSQLQEAGEAMQKQFAVASEAVQTPAGRPKKK